MKDLQEKAEAALDAAAAAQRVFWEAVSDLENALSYLTPDLVEVDGTDDLSNATVEYLLHEGSVE